MEERQKIDCSTLYPEKDINTLELEMADLKKKFEKDKKSKQLKCEIDKYTRAIYLRKTYAKAFAEEYEKNNFQYLIFVTTGKDLYKLTFYSALTFHFEVAKRIHESSNLMFDNDRYSRSQSGVVTKRLSQILFTKLESVDIRLTEEVKYDGPKSDVFIFKLPYKHSEEQLKYMIEQAELGSTVFNASMMPKNPYPNFYVEICEARDATIDLNGHLRRTNELLKVGEEVFETIREMFCGYLDLAMERKDVFETLLDMKHQVILIKNNLKFIESSNKFKDKASVHRVGSHIMKCEKILIRLIKNQSKIRDAEIKMAKAKNKGKEVK